MAACQTGGHTHVAVEAVIGLGRSQGDEVARQLRSAEALAHQIANRELLDQVTKTLAETVGGAASPLPGNLTVRQAEVLGSSPMA